MKRCCWRTGASRVLLRCTPCAAPHTARACRLDEATLNQKELVLIEKLDFQLIAEHPYQHLEALLAGACRTQICFCSVAPVHV
jgi:hypothetical protein